MVSIPTGASWLRRRARAAVSAVLAISAAAFAVSCGFGGPGLPSGPAGHYKLGGPYQIDGRWYYPAYDPTYDEVGVASWYGDAFDGRPTANGETFDMFALSAAHTTMPLPSEARVTNLDNGRSIVVRVNDRGPFVGDRIIDLSRSAAEELGFRDRGLARVRVEFLSLADATGTPPRPGEGGRSVEVAMGDGPEALGLPVGSRFEVEPSAGAVGDLTDPAAAALVGDLAACERQAGFVVQIGAFRDGLAARAHAQRAAGLGPAWVEPVGLDGVELSRVRIGPLADRAAAIEAMDRLAAMGYGDTKIALDAC